MSMLYYFFSIREKKNSYLFNHLKISDHKDILAAQNRYPVIFLSFKDMAGSTYEKQLESYADLLYMFANEHLEILDSPDVPEFYKTRYRKFLDDEATDRELRSSLLFLSNCLEKCYHQKVIILLDEYDVPLAKAYSYGYYDQMVEFIRTLFSSALKGNNSLLFAVLTGCLRIAKESIFTGLNNLSVHSIFDTYGEEDFGFTKDEVDSLLNYYHLESNAHDIQSWYDGYRFGKADIYNPWSVLSYLNDCLYSDAKAKPKAYWLNTSSNDIIQSFINRGSTKLKREFQALTEGGSVIKYIDFELSYREMDHIYRLNNDLIYSYLLFTGYLKPVRHLDDYSYELKIPNREIKAVYEQQFMQWFHSFSSGYQNEFKIALINGKCAEAEQILNHILSYTLSYYDTKENFYHGLLIGLLSDDYANIISNRESGNGRFDICFIEEDVGVIIECQYASSKDVLDQRSVEAYKQIEKQHYDVNMTYPIVRKYGISFYKKQCCMTDGSKKDHFERK